MQQSLHLSGAGVKKSDALLVRSLEDRLRTLRFSQWLSPQFTVLSYSTVQPFICIFGRCLTESLLCNIQLFYWACPVDSGSRRRANGLEKRLLSRPRRTSLHHSRSSEGRRVILLTLLPFRSLLSLLLGAPPPLTNRPKPGEVRYEAVHHPRGH